MGCACVCKCVCVCVCARAKQEHCCASRVKRFLVSIRCLAALPWASFSDGSRRVAVKDDPPRWATASSSGFLPPNNRVPVKAASPVAHKGWMSGMAGDRWCSSDELRWLLSSVSGTVASADADVRANPQPYKLMGGGVFTISAELLKRTHPRRWRAHGTPLCDTLAGTNSMFEIDGHRAVITRLSTTYRRMYRAT